MGKFLQISTYNANRHHCYISEFHVIYFLAMHFFPTITAYHIDGGNKV